MVILNRSLGPERDLISAKSGSVLQNVPAEVGVCNQFARIYFPSLLIGAFFSWKLHLLFQEDI